MIYVFVGIVVRFIINWNVKYGDDLFLRNLNCSLNMIFFWIFEF